MSVQTNAQRLHPVALSEPSGEGAATNRKASLTVALGTLLAVLDLGLVNISLPAMATAMNATQSQAIWIATVYQLSCAAMLLAFSALSYTLGPRRVYLAGLLLFTSGALGAALAPGLAILIAFRVMQGLGAAALLSIGPALLRHIYPPEQLGRAIGLNAQVVAFGLVAGPSLGGVVLALADWRGVFVLTIPIGLVAIWLAWSAIATTPIRRGDFDWSGAVFSALMMVSVLLALERMGHGTRTVFVLVLWLLALTACLLFIVRQLRAPRPLVPLGIFYNRRFSLAIIATLLAFVSQGVAFVSLSFLYQSTLQYSPLEAALLFAPWPLALLISGPWSGRQADKISPAWLSTAGLLIYLVGVSWLAWSSNGGGVLALSSASLICGLGYGLFQAPNNHEVMANASRELSSTASGVLAAVRTLGQSLGSATVALVLGGSADGMQHALWIAAMGAGLALIVSLLRCVVPSVDVGG